MECEKIKPARTRLATPLGVAVVALLVAIAGPYSAEAGKLSGVRSAVRHEDSHDDHDDDHSHGHHRRHPGCCCDDDDDGGFVSQMIAGLFWDDDPDPVYYERVVVEPIPHEQSIYGPQTVVVREAAEEPAMCFAEYPYADGWDGYMLCPDVPRKQRNWSGRVGFEWGSDFDDLDRWSGALLLEGAGGWGLDTHWNAYNEDRGPAGHDRLRINDLNVLFRFVETPRTQIRVGAGLNWLSDTESNVGFNLTLKMDYYPVEPLVVSAEIDWGTLGAAEMFHASATVGTMVNRFELFAGFDYRGIGGAELVGPFAGARVWF